MKTKKNYYYTFVVWYYDNNNNYNHCEYICRTLKDAKKIHFRISTQKSWNKYLGYRLESLSTITRNVFDSDEI